MFQFTVEKNPRSAQGHSLNNLVITRVSDITHQVQGNRPIGSGEEDF